MTMLDVYDVVVEIMAVTELVPLVTLPAPGAASVFPELSPNMAETGPT